MSRRRLSVVPLNLSVSPDRVGISDPGTLEYVHAWRAPPEAGPATSCYFHASGAPTAGEQASWRCGPVAGEPALHLIPERPAIPESGGSARPSRSRRLIELQCFLCRQMTGEVGLLSGQLMNSGARTDLLSSCWRKAIPSLVAVCLSNFGQSQPVLRERDSNVVCQHPTVSRQYGAQQSQVLV